MISIRSQEIIWILKIKCKLIYRIKLNTNLYIIWHKLKLRMKINHSVLVQWTQGSFSFKWFPASCTWSLLEGDLSTYSSSTGDGCIHMGLINGHKLTTIHCRVSVLHNSYPWDWDHSVTEVQTFKGFPEKQTLLPLPNILITVLFSSTLLCSSTADV